MENYTIQDKISDIEIRILKNSKLDFAQNYKDDVSFLLDLISYYKKIVQELKSLQDSDLRNSFEAIKEIQEVLLKFNFSSNINENI